MAFRLKEFLLYLVSHKKRRYNMIKKALYPVFLLLCFIYLPLAQAEEKITLSTYYPAPAGEYDKLAAKRMVVGATYPFPDENNLTVEGNVGIGTTSPTEKLDVAGNININEASAYLFNGVNGLKLSKNGEGSYYSTLVGAGAGNSGSASSTRQTALGRAAGNSNSGASQTALGYSAGQSNTGDYQTALGYAAGYSNTGDYQTALGYAAGYSNTGDYQTALGHYAGQSNTGDYQTALGHYAGQSNTGARQTALGYYAGRSNSGAHQTALGHAAGYSNTGARQTALGYAAGRENSGDRVTGIGYEATYLNTADDVVAIGYQAGKSNAVANQFIVKQANINAIPLIQGDFSTGNVGIGTTTPGAKLEIVGTAKATNFSGIANSLVTIQATATVGSTSAGTWTGDASCPAGYTIVFWGAEGSTQFWGGKIRMTHWYSNCQQNGNGIRASLYTQKGYVGHTFRCRGLCAKD
jgi:hypothetical protein